MRGRFRTVWIAAALALTAISYAISWDSLAPSPLRPLRDRRMPVRRTLHTPEPAEDACGIERALAPPAEQPVQLTCWQAKMVTAQARNNLAQPPPPVDAKEFATTTLEWLDPHGLWSASPDSPVSRAMLNHSSLILASLRTPHDDRGCAAATAVGASLGRWVDDLRQVFDDSRSAPSPPTEPWIAASAPVFEDGPVHRPARTLASNLGKRSHELEISLELAAADVTRALRNRLFPKLSTKQWGGAVLAAAVRAYVLHVDAHGAWAPYDEETSLYEVELDGTGRRHLWGLMTRTAAGVRVDEHPVPPLAVGDVLLSIGGVPTAGLSVEQVEQLGILDPNDPHPSREVVLLRKGAGTPQRAIVTPPSPAPIAATDDARAAVRMERIPYRRGHVAVLTVLDIPDGLGLELAATLAEARLGEELEGVLLDLRGNGGGSIDGAREALAPFLSGAPLFPMRRRDGTVELEFAPVAPATDRFAGPVAALVGPDTASAAEMIAGALSAYDRGKVVGMRTFGKGCAQEYLDDDVGIGVLRLSTLVYALPDGSPVQKVGIRPDIRLDCSGKAQREDSLPNAMLPWKGPDVRRLSMIGSKTWPSHGGRVGPCKDEIVCRALRVLGNQRGARARSNETR